MSLFIYFESTLDFIHLHISLLLCCPDITSLISYTISKDTYSYFEANSNYEMRVIKAILLASSKNGIQAKSPTQHHLMGIVTAYGLKLHKGTILQKGFESWGRNLKG